MTQPPEERPQPGQWSPPPAAQPQPQWTPPQSSSPSPGPQPPYQPQPQPDSTVWTPQPAPPTPKRRAPLIASLVAVVALGAGGAITYVALSDSGSSGAATPKEAVQNVVNDMENSDFVGLLDDLAPGERDALANPVRADIDKLKELHVLNQSADPSNISGVTFQANNLQYASKPITINDHVQIVQLTGGTITLTGDSSKLPLSDEIRKMAPPNQTSTVHYNLSDKPVRIATEKVGGRWYPSLFYTAADSAAGHRVPSASDAIPALGSASAEDAVRDEVNALLAGDLRTALAHISPVELGAVHDYGGMILAQTPGWSEAGIQVETLDLTSSPLSGGGTHVGLKKLVLSKDGDRISIEIDGTCMSVSASGQAKKFCPNDAAKAVSGFLGSFACIGSASSDCRGSALTPAQKTAIGDLFTGLTKLGIATSEVNGKWYVDPIRSTVDEWGTLLGGLKGNDLLELAKLGR